MIRTIKDLKEFINQHELPDDTEINISVNSLVKTDVDFFVITKRNDEPIKHKLLLSDATLKEKYDDNN